MKAKLLLIIFCLFIFNLPAFAQNKEARKFDEFGNISCDDLSARLESFYMELKASKDLKGYIFIYVGNLVMPLYNQDGKNNQTSTQ